jgi:hypothetical protein
MENYLKNLEGVSAWFAHEWGAALAGFLHGDPSADGSSEGLERILTQSVDLFTSWFLFTHVHKVHWICPSRSDEVNHFDRINDEF